MLSPAPAGGPALADVDAVGVGAVAQQVHIPDPNAIQLADGEVPGAGIAQDHAFERDVLPLDEQQVTCVRRATAAVHDASPAEGDIGPSQYKPLWHSKPMRLTRAVCLPDSGGGYSSL